MAQRLATPEKIRTLQRKLYVKAKGKKVGYAPWRQSFGRRGAGPSRYGG